MGQFNLLKKNKGNLGIKKLKVTSSTNLKRYFYKLENTVCLGES